MCAILGVIGKIPDQLSVIKARDAMVHRGPDDEGIYYVPKDGCALAHRRLSIIDLSSAGKQPLVSSDGRFVIVFNGEIYNYRELKEELKYFYTFKTQTDTEVLLASYKKWGPECLKKLNGMFAFAIWDRKEKKLFCARDRLGVKPFFYSIQKGTLYFASEIKGILSVSDIPRKLNRKGFLDFLNYRYVLGEETLFKGIFSLLPAHYATYREKGNMQIKRYWDIPLPRLKEDEGEERVLQRTEELLQDSIRLRLRSDVPVGAYLSGGLDSSLIVALMAAGGARDLKTFSVGFEEDEFNELPYARRVSDLFGTDHHDFVLTANEYMGTLAETVRAKDAPLLSPNEVAWLLLSKKMKKDITVVLSGGGADELFGGYGKILRSGYDLERMRQIEEAGSVTEEEKKILVENLKRKYASVSLRSATDHFLAQYPYSGILGDRTFFNQEVFADIRELHNESYFKVFFKSLEELHPTDQYLRFFETAHLRGTMESLDSMTMAASLEGREPYLDFRLVEYVEKLPLKYKLAWKSADHEIQARTLNADQISEVHDITKYLLRKIGLHYLPAEIVNRKKMGFPVPLQDWTTGPMKKLAQEALLGSGSLSSSLYDRKALEALFREDAFSPRLGRDIWALLNMEIWTKEYDVVI